MIPVCEQPELFERLLLSTTVKLTFNCSEVSLQGSPNFVHHIFSPVLTWETTCVMNICKKTVFQENVLVFAILVLTLKCFQLWFSGLHIFMLKFLIEDRNFSLKTPGFGYGAYLADLIRMLDCFEYLNSLTLNDSALRNSVFFVQIAVKALSRLN